MYYIFDLDGTLADISHRLHFIEGNKKDWDAFYDACSEDIPIKKTISLLINLYYADNNIIILSGRSDAVKEKTMKWLKDNLSVVFFTLYMRKTGDHRPDVEVKQEWLDEWLKHHKKEEISIVFEDRKQVVDMWRKNKIVCYQVANGNY